MSRMSVAPAELVLGADEAAALLEELDMTVVEAGPATMARKCSTDNGCDTQASGDC